MNTIAKKGKWTKFCEKRQEILGQISRNGLNEFSLCQLVAVTKGRYKIRLRQIAMMEIGIERTWELIDHLGLDDVEKEEVLEVLAENIET